MVEARGVEPLSETPSAKASTRLADHLKFSDTLGRPAALHILETCLISPRRPVTRLQGQPAKCHLAP